MLLLQIFWGRAGLAPPDACINYPNHVNALINNTNLSSQLLLLSLFIISINALSWNIDPQSSQLTLKRRPEREPESVGNNRSNRHFRRSLARPRPLPTAPYRRTTSRAGRRNALKTMPTPKEDRRSASKTMLEEHSSGAALHFRSCIRAGCCCSHSLVQMVGLMASGS